MPDTARRWFGCREISNEFGRLRKVWREQLTGGTAYNGSDPDISAQVAKLTARAQAFWEAMDKSPEEYLWSDLAGADASAHYTSALYNNARLQDSLLTGLDWMYRNLFLRSPRDLLSS